MGRMLAINPMVNPYDGPNDSSSGSGPVRLLNFAPKTSLAAVLHMSWPEIPETMYIPPSYVLGPDATLASLNQFFFYYWLYEEHTLSRIGLRPFITKQQKMLMAMRHVSEDPLDLAKYISSKTAKGFIQSEFTVPRTYSQYLTSQFDLAMEYERTHRAEFGVLDRFVRVAPSSRKYSTYMASGVRILYEYVPSGGETVSYDRMSLQAAVIDPENSYLRNVARLLDPDDPLEAMIFNIPIPYSKIRFVNGEMIPDNRNEVLSVNILQESGDAFVLGSLRVYYCLAEEPSFERRSIPIIGENPTFIPHKGDIPPFATRGPKFMNALTRVAKVRDNKFVLVDKPSSVVGRVSVES
jgi:hypothetical protein